jgi:hypothetical protein
MGKQRLQVMSQLQVAPQIGQTLSAVDGVLSDVNNKGAVSFQWLRDGANILRGNAINLHIGCRESINGKSISVKASYTDGLNKLESVTSAAVNAAYGQTPPTGDVRITGTPQIGQTLSAVDGLSDVNNKGAVSFQCAQRWRKYLRGNAINLHIGCQ